jgi:MoxR-like ATPase
MKMNLGLELRASADVQELEFRVRDLVREKNIIPSKELESLSFEQLLEKVIIIYLPDSDYKKLKDYVKSLSATYDA